MFYLNSNSDSNLSFYHLTNKGRENIINVNKCKRGVEMAFNQPIIYLLADRSKYIIGLSTLPELEAKSYLEKGVIDEEDCKLFFLTDKLSWGVADYIIEEITTTEEQVGREIERDTIVERVFNLLWKIDPLGRIIEDKLLQIKRILKKFSLVERLSGQRISNDEIYEINWPDTVAWQQVYRVIQGRRLYYNEIRQLLRENRVVVNNLNKVLVYLKIKGRLKILTAVSYQGKQPICQRCGSRNLREVDCNYCYQKDYYCEDCLLMGEARGCRPLYLIPAINRIGEFRLVEPILEFELTKLQQDISKDLVSFLSEDYREALVWAVCGAGKTEVSFDLIAEGVSGGGRVLFAIPRKDVVIELMQRLKEAFPKVKIKGLYGGSKRKYQEARLVVATTHQLLRYYQAFDLVILDEMDAFPYQGSEILRRAVKEAKKIRGKLVYMTATPRDDDLDQLEDDKCKLIKLMARYHGYPLPEPELVIDDLYYDKEIRKFEPGQKLLEKLRLSIEGDLSQVFLFVPLREMVDIVVERLNSYFPKVNGSNWIQGSHSQDKNRKEKREGFLAGDYPVLVSTTIMERGVTVKKANVIVLFADWNFIFTEQALVQMAGRSGRSLEYPEGRVWFIGNEITQEMKKARKQIVGLNKEAREKGYLRGNKLSAISYQP